MRVLRNLRKEDETLKQERCARREAWDLAKLSTSSKMKDKATFNSLAKAWVMPVPSSKKARRARIRCRFLSIDAHAEQKGLELKWTGNPSKIQEPHNRGNGQWEVQSNEEARVYVHDLDLFVAVQLLEDTPAVQSLGKLCEKHGYTHEWPVVKSRIWPSNGKSIPCKTLSSRDCRQAPAQVRLVQAWFPKKWPHSEDCYCYLRNFQDFLADGKTQGPVFPFGAVVEYHPISARDQSRFHQSGKKVLPEVFRESVLVAGDFGKETNWLQTMRSWTIFDASEIHGRTLNAKDLLTPRRDEHFSCSRSRMERQKFFSRNSERSQPSETKDDAEACNDFRSLEGDFLYRHHVEPRDQLYVPKEERFAIPLKYIDLTRTTHTNLHVLQERRIDDCWNVDVDRNVSDSWTGFTEFTALNEKLTKGLYAIH